ncbi:centromere protein Q [Arapaima gigas]
MKRIKPVRTSGRATSLAPKRKERGSKSHNGSSQEAGPSGTRVSQPMQPRKTVTEISSRKAKGRDKWKPLPKESITALENMLSLSVLSVLTMKRKDKEECQKHLNIVKDRFMARCAQLVTPPRKLWNPKQDSRLHQEERKKAEVGRRSLEALEAEVSATLQRLEHTEARLDSLEQEGRILRNKMEQQEERESIQQATDQGVLHLPQLPAGRVQERPLQERLADMVPDCSAAASLARALHGSAEVQEVLVFLEQAHERADALLRSLALSPTQSSSSQEQPGPR